MDNIGGGELDKIDELPLLLYLPFKGKREDGFLGEDLYEHDVAEQELENVLSAMKSLAQEFQSSYQIFPVRLVTQNNPKGNYLRWRESTRFSHQGSRAYLYPEQVINFPGIPEATRKKLHKYSLRVSWLNMQASILNHTLIAMKKFKGDTEHIVI